MNSVIQLKKAISGLLIAFVLACFPFPPTALAVTPAPDGGYAGANTAEGTNALFSLTTGLYNTAVGANAVFSDTTGGRNTANGYNALHFNTIGSSNTAIGTLALANNTTGAYNVAIGDSTLSSNTTGSANIAIGFQAGLFTTGVDNIDIGNVGVAGENVTIRIGTQGVQTRAFIGGVGAPVTGTPLVVSGAGQLGVAPSSQRFKEEIKPMDKASEVILALKPVTFRYKKELDPDGVPQFGLVAEEVAKVNPDLVTRDDKGQAYTVRYDAVNAMLLNEFLKQHRRVQRQEAAIIELKSR